MYIVMQSVSYCLLLCFECVSVENAFISSFSLPINLIFCSMTSYFIHSQSVSCCLVPCFECMCVSVESACVFLLKVHVFLPFIHQPYINSIHRIMYTFSAGELVSCPMFSLYFAESVESACIFSVSSSFHSSYNVHFQLVSCSLLLCFNCVFLLQKVHVFRLFLYPLT